MALVSSCDIAAVAAVFSGADIQVVLGLVIGFVCAATAEEAAEATLAPVAVAETAPRDEEAEAAKFPLPPLSVGLHVSTVLARRNGEGAGTDCKSLECLLVVSKALLRCLSKLPQGVAVRITEGGLWGGVEDNTRFGLGCDEDEEVALLL